MTGTSPVLSLHLVSPHSAQYPSFPQRISAPGVCTFASPTPNRGVGGAPRNVRVLGGTPVGRIMTRYARRLRGALRPMTQQYTGRNNVTISMSDDGSVPIVSQREIDPMKTALSLTLALVTTTALAEPFPGPQPRGQAARARTAISRAAHSAPRRRVLRTPSPSRATALARRDGLRRAPTAREMAVPGSSFALASFSLVEGHAVPRGLPPRRLNFGAP